MPEIHVLGLSYKTCPVEIREKLAVSSAGLSSAISEILALGASEAVVLSTCNRVEIYWASHPMSETKNNILTQWCKRSGHELQNHYYSHKGPDAALHLFRVAAGLDSMILGEPQILGQVKWAYQIALGAGFTGKNLNPLFQAAMAAGKWIRTATSIATGTTSVSSAAVLLAEKIFGDLSQRAVMVLGAGKMAGAAAKHFGSKKVKAIFVANRTYEHAVDLAQALGGQAMGWEEALARMKDMDVVLSSTACPTFVLRQDQMRSVMKERKGRPLFLIDIAVPRDVDPVVARLPHVYLYDIDDLKGIVAAQAQTKAQEARIAQGIVEEKSRKYWLARFGPRPLPIPRQWSLPAAAEFRYV